MEICIPITSKGEHLVFLPSFVTIVSCILYSKESYLKFTSLVIKNHRFDFDEAFCLQTNYYPQYALHNVWFSRLFSLKENLSCKIHYYEIDR